MGADWSCRAGGRLAPASRLATEMADCSARTAVRRSSRPGPNLADALKAYSVVRASARLREGH